MVRRYTGYLQVLVSTADGVDVTATLGAIAGIGMAVATARFAVLLSARFDRWRDEIRFGPDDRRDLALRFARIAE
jgi:uncharacterized membrane-anchored protein